MAQEPSDEMKRYMRELQKLVYEHGYQSGTLSNRHFSQKELAEYAADLKYYERIYPQYSWKNLNHTQSIGAALKGKGIDIGVAYRREEAKKKGFFKNVDAERIREIEQKFTQPDMRGFFPEYEQGDSHSRVFTSFDVETDDRGHILTIAGHKVQYNYSKQRMENADVPNPTWYRAYTPANADIRATEATHHLNIPILSAIRNKLKASYSDTFNADERNAFLNWAGNSTLFGHNIAEADLPWIFNKARGWNTEIGFKKSYIDTLQLARALFKGQPNSLDRVASRLGVGFEQLGLSHHQAEADVVVTARLLEKLVQGNASIRNNFDIDNIQSNAYNERNVVRGGSGLFHKIGGKLVMSDVYDNEDATRAELENELRFNPDTSFHIDEPGFAAGSANDYAMSRVADAAEAVQQLVSNNRVNIHYNNRDRAVQSVIRDLKAGKMTSAYIYNSVATNWGDLFDKSQQNAIVSEALKRIGLDETALTGASLQERLQHARFDYAKRIGASRRNSAYWQNSENNKFDRIMRGEGAWDDLRGMPNHLKKSYASGWSNGDLEKAINSRRRLDAIAANGRTATATKTSMLNAADIPLTDKERLKPFLDSASESVEKFDERLKKLKKTVDENSKATEFFSDKFAANFKGPDWYDWEKLGSAVVSGKTDVANAYGSLTPRFLKDTYGAMRDAYKMDMQGQQARGNAIYRNATGIFNVGATAIGAAVGGNAGATVVGGGARLLTNIVGNWAEGKITEHFKERAAQIYLLGSAFQAVLTPLKLFHNGLRSAAGLFARLGNIWGTQYGMPLTHLTGISSPEYSAMLDTDVFMGMKQGTTNSMHNAMSLGSAGLYSSGRFDTNRLVAAARLGVFNNVYAPMGTDAKKMMAGTVNSLVDQLRGADAAKRQQIMFLANDIDTNLPNILQRLDSFSRYLGKSIKYEDYQTGKAFASVWQRQMSNPENAAWEWTAGEYNASRHQTQMGLKRLATPLWNKFGRPIWNSFNEHLNAFADTPTLAGAKNAVGGFSKDVKNILGISGDANWLESISSMWTNTIQSSVIDAFKTGVGWLQANGDELEKAFRPIVETFYGLLEDIDPKAFFRGQTAIKHLQAAEQFNTKYSKVSSNKSVTAGYVSDPRTSFGFKITGNSQYVENLIRAAGDVGMDNTNKFAFERYLELMSVGDPNLKWEYVGGAQYDKNKKEADNLFGGVKNFFSLVGNTAAAFLDRGGALDKAFEGAKGLITVEVAVKGDNVESYTVKGPLNSIVNAKQAVGY